MTYSLTRSTAFHAAANLWAYAVVTLRESNPLPTQKSVIRTQYDVNYS